MMRRNIFVNALISSLAPSSRTLNAHIAGLLILVLACGPIFPVIASRKDAGTKILVSNSTKRSGPAKRKPVLAAQVQAASVLPGQTITLLPDGSSLLIGGESENGVQDGVAISDLRTGQPITVKHKLHRARAWHTATMLPDGRILILGGVGPNNVIEDSLEIFDPGTQSLTLSRVPAVAARAYHTATLLTDGSVLITGGSSTQAGQSSNALLWDFKTNTFRTLPAKLSAHREKHKATLLQDGNILIEGGTDSDRNSVASAELFNAEAGSFNFTSISSNQLDRSAPFLSGSLPANGAAGVPVDSYIALRLSKQLRVETLNSETLILTGPEGTLETKIVPAETGRLAFVKSKSALLPGITYTISITGAVDDGGGSITPASTTFTTRGSSGPDVETPDAEDWSPGANNFHGNWKRKHEDSPWRSLPNLQAEEGVTALAGQALTMDGKPLDKVTLKIGDSAVQTDNTGRFLLTSIAAGHQVLIIDGRTASRNRKAYGVFKVGVDLQADKTNPLGFTIWMPKLDMRNAVTLSAPTKSPLKITNPNIPGLELRLPAGTVIRDVDGQTVTQISITPIPTNQTPFPLPPNVNVPTYFTIQPGGSQIIPPRAQLIYPNFTNSLPGTRIDFWNYDPVEKGWYVYGKGTVTPDRKQIVPDPGVVLYEFSGAMIALPDLAALLGPLAGLFDGDPVDLGTGLLVVDLTDLVVMDTMPIRLTRTYRPNDTISRSFGIGATHPFDIFLIGDTFPYTYQELILPDGGRIHYDRISPGTHYTDAVYEAATRPGDFFKSRISWNGNGWDLKLKDGTLYVFPEAFGVSRPSQAAPTRIQDRFGNALVLSRESNGNLTKITSPNNRWMEFTYDSNFRVTQAKDNIGRIVTYTYDTGGRLWKVTNPDNGITEYTYDSSHRMLTVKDARGIVYLTNEYDTNGRVFKQILADDTPAISTDNPTYQFAYTVDSGGRIVQTDVTDPRGNVRRVTFSTLGHSLTDTSAFGTPEQQGVSFERQSGTNQVTAIIDALGRRTEYSYDSMGNVTSVTAFAGTSSAVTTSLTYDPTFNQVTSVTNALNHTTSYEYDTTGNLISITDPLTNKTTFSYNSAGKISSVTDALENTTSFAYDSGDLAHVTDPLNRTISLFTDRAGRVLSLTDASGNSTKYEYDVFNHVKKVTEAQGGVTEFTYDPNGNLLTLKDARNQTTTFTYDASDRPLSRTDALQGSTSTESYEYDLEGNPTKLTDRRGKVTTFSYDALDRPIFIGFGTTAGPTYESTTSYSYDLYDRVTQVVDSVSGTTNISFDDLARTASETTPQGTVGFTYDQIGRLTGKSVSGQSAISYGYDNASRLLSIAQGLSSVSFTYDDAHRRSSMTLPNSVLVEYGYDAASQLTSLVYRNGTTTLGDLTYSYDKSGLRTGMGGTLARTVLPQPLSTATYNANNQLTQRGTATLTYDANGNLTSDGANTYTWDARNQLTAISGAVNASFQYDAFGRRVRKTVNGATTDYLYDGSNVVQEKVGGTPTANMLTGDVDEIFSRTESAGTQSIVADGLGSTLALLDPAAATQTEYTYDPFGNTSTSGSASTNSSQYTNRENDGTGLYYYRARYYSPAMQRFISEDPIDFAGGDTNLYAYVSNSPCNFTDPSGNAAWAVGGCVVGAAASLGYDYFSGRKLSAPRALAACAIGAALGPLLRPLLGPLLRAGAGRAPRFPRLPSLNPKPPPNYPKPPNWKPDWEWRYPTTTSPKTSPRWFDPKGGEWRWHPPDKWHPKGHWDYNPWDQWNSPWQNIFP